MICFPLSPCGEESDMVDEICFLLEYCPFDVIVGGCKENQIGRRCVALFCMEEGKEWEKFR